MNDESKSISGGYADAQYSDELINHYIDEAERQACENSMFLFDRSTPYICEINVTAGQSQYRIDPRILRVDRVDFIAEDTTTRQNVVIQTRTNYDSDFPDWRDRNFTELYTCFGDENTIELAGNMNVSGIIYLEVYRLPLNDASTMDQFEMGARNHSWLMHWVKYLAYNNKDADLYAPQLAEVHKREFERRFGYPKDGDTWRYSQKNKPLRSTYHGA